MFPNIFSQIVFYSLVSDWLLRLFKSSEISESPKSVVHETEDHRKEKQSCHAQSAYPKVAGELHTELPDAEYANGKREPTLVQPDRTAKINNKVIIKRLKRKLQSVESANDALITEDRKLKTNLIATERTHADEMQAMKWNQEDLETKMADAKLEQKLKTEQALAQNRMEISQLRELNSQLIKEN